MGNPLKQIAGETAVYGLSTILARIINFALVPMYTRMLSTGSYGVFTEFMAYIAVLQVALVMGLETGCFRFANKEGCDPRKVYSSALAAVFGVNAAFLACVVVFAGPIAAALGYDGYGNVIKYVGGILACDNFTAILFAKLRQEHKALKFALIKTAKILMETLSNVLLFFFYPAFCAQHPANLLSWAVSASPDFTYPIFAVFAGSILCLLLFLPDIAKLSFEFDGKLLKKMLAYSMPLMIAGLPGIVNDFLDRLLFRWFDTDPEAWRSSLGIYQAAVKLAVIMNLFIQMFRYAAEPFFFQRASDRHSKDMYAILMEFFTAFCGLIFLGIIMYIDVISLLLGQDFRAGIGVVPVMLLSYMLLGMLFNVSMWYKLSGRTEMAIWITAAGLVVTVIVNVAFMPRFSYWASAFGHLASYMVMFVMSACLGAKYNPFPYKWGRILSLFGIMGVLYAAAAVIGQAFFREPGIHPMQLVINTFLIIIYLAACVVMLRGRYAEIRKY